MKAVRKGARSGEMRCPVCDVRAMLVEHHIHGRDIPGKNRKWNRCFVCPNCHDMIHAGKIILEGWSMTSHGKDLIWREKGEEEVTLREASPKLYKNNLN